MPLLVCSEDLTSEVGGNTVPPPMTSWLGKRVGTHVLFFILKFYGTMSRTSLYRSLPRRTVIQQYGVTGGLIGPARRPLGPVRRVYPLPRRAYAGSRVPLRSGGYTPNAHERKVFDITNTIYQANSTPSVVNQFAMTQGTDFNQRIGRKVIIKSIQCRGMCVGEGAKALAMVGAAAQYIRCIMLVDMQPNGSLPTAANILASATDPTSFMNLDNRDRFKVIWDKKFVLDPFIFQTGTNLGYSCSNQIKQFDIYKKCNIEVIFNNVNGGTIADIQSGSIIFLSLGTTAAGLNTDANIIMSTRLRYLDG